MLLIGFMGAFTTFSAFILETGQLARSAEWLSAILNLFAQIGLGLIALTVGAALGRTI
jgi:CrcB protein